MSSALSFEDDAFDCVVANWMLYHAPDIDLALSELARVLSRRGRLVAATNSTRHLEELWQLVGRDKSTSPVLLLRGRGRAPWPVLREGGETGRRQPDLVRHRRRARGYVGSSIAHKHLAARVPDLIEPLVATRRCTVFVAESA